MAAEREPTVIKKYANRRLYHTGTSSYVTLEDLAALVRNGEEFVVYDAKTGDDLTRSVLAQIIFEEENKTGNSLLPIAFLRQLIRFYGDSMQVLVPRYLEMSIENFMREQQSLREHLSKTFGSNAFEALEAQTRANMKLFNDALRVFAPFAAPAAGTEQPAPDPQAKAAREPTAVAEDVEQLRSEMARMREKLDALSRRT